MVDEGYSYIKCSTMCNDCKFSKILQPFHECFTILHNTYYKTPFLYQYTSGVAVNIYMIFILTKMLFILNVFSLK